MHGTGSSGKEASVVGFVRKSEVLSAPGAFRNSLPNVGFARVDDPLTPVEDAEDIIAALPPNLETLSALRTPGMVYFETSPRNFCACGAGIPDAALWRQLKTILSEPGFRFGT